MQRAVNFISTIANLNMGTIDDDAMDSAIGLAGDVLPSARAAQKAVIGLLAALEEVRSWNNSDIRAFEDITPNLAMLQCRRKVIAKAILQARKAGISAEA